MKITNEKVIAAAEALRAAAGKLKNRHTAAIIVAAGSGTRMNSDIPKQFISLCGMPVVVHTLKAYDMSACISEIIIVCRPGDEDTYSEYCKNFGIVKPVKTVIGGDTRQKSVLCGIEAVSPQTAYVAIADGARPLITPEQIDSVCIAAYRHGAATAACPATDTIKTAEKGFITDTVPRSTVWHATTPQAFALSVYRAAAYSSMEEGFEGTDDNSLCEHIGYDVKLVDCGRFNIKITEKEDLIIAEALLKSRVADKAYGDSAENNTENV